MNGTIQIPNFLNENDLPQGYFDEYNPMQPPGPCNVNLKELSRYACEKGCKIVDLSEEEFERFVVNN